MEQPAAKKSAEEMSTDSAKGQATLPVNNGTAITPQICPMNGKSMNGLNSEIKVEPVFIYAIGRIEPRFPNQSIEKEFLQATSREDTKGQTDHETMHSVLSQKQYRYLARQLCWVMTIAGIETYILKPKSPEDIDLLIEAIRPNPSHNDLDMVIGIKGPIAPLDMCNGLMVPIVFFDQIYSFDMNSLIGSIPKPEKKAAKEFENSAKELFERIMQITDNAGATDEHRALNYLAVRYSLIYSTASEAFDRNCSLTSIEAWPSRLSGTRKIISVIFTFTNKGTGVDEKFFARVDVTEEFPFLISRMSPYYNR